MATSVIYSGMAILLIPILTRNMSTKQYGVYSLFLVAVNLMLPVSNLSAAGAVFRKYVDRMEIDFPRLVTNCIFIVVAGTAISGSMLYILRDLINDIFKFQLTWIWAIIAVVFMQSMGRFGMSLLQISHRPMQFGCLRIVQSFVLLAGMTIFVVGLGLGWKGAIISNVFSFFAIAVISIIYLVKEKLIKFEINSQDIKYGLRYGVPLVPHVLGSSLISFTDRIFITKYVSVEETGVYTVAAQISMGISFLATSFNRAWTPFVFRKLKKSDMRERNQVVIFTYVYGLVLLLVTGVYIFGIILATPLLVSQEFIRIVEFVPWLCAGFFLSGLYYMVSVYIFYSERTELILISTCTAALCNIGLNAILVPGHGAAGAAVSTTAANFIVFIFTWYMSSRVIKMPWILNLTQRI